MISKRIERQGKPCKACGTKTVRVTYDMTPYPTIVWCPRCDRRDRD